MAERGQWLTKLKNEFSNSPLVSNVAFGFILMGLEKLVELEFECPCNPKWNGLFSSAFFIIPAIMAFTLMLIIQGCRCDKFWDTVSVSVSSFVPAIVWLILLFLDGQYFACAMTDWKGRFILIEEADPQKWCEPISEGDVTPQELMLRSQELMLHSQELFVISQVIGMSLLIFVCLGLIVYLIRKICQEKKEEKKKKEEEEEKEEKKKKKEEKKKKKEEEKTEEDTLKAPDLELGPLGLS